MEEHEQNKHMASSTAVTMGDENEEIFEPKLEEQLTQSLKGTNEEGYSLPSPRILLAREQQLRLQIQDRQAFSGARCFLYLFETLAMLVYLTNSLLEHVSSWEELTIVLSSLGVSLYHYRRCHSISTKIHSASVVRQGTISISEEATSEQVFYCGYCKASRGLRVKHCVKCDACIYKYDHHCFWVGNCIGELNQFNFYSFLLSQTVFNCAMTGVFWRLPADTFLYWLYMMLMVVALGFAGFTSFLLIYHTMLIATSQTTWQHVRRHRISYLKGLPRGCHPFSQGLIKNFWQFFRKRHSLTHWDIPPNIADSKHYDLFDNEYYSCC